jgi:flagellar assembly factor FliW
MTATSVYTGGSRVELTDSDPFQEPSTETFETSRFGQVEVILDTIITFPDGLIGLGGHRYALLSTDPNSPFLWLQSLEQPTVALPVTNPHQFFADFAVELEDAEAEQLGLDQGAAADVYVTVTASSVVTDITVNLKAPILVRDRRGHQVMNKRPGALVKTPLFPAAAAAA